MKQTIQKEAVTSKYAKRLKLRKAVSRRLSLGCVAMPIPCMSQEVRKRFFPRAA